MKTALDSSRTALRREWFGPGNRRRPRTAAAGAYGFDLELSTRSLPRAGDHSRGKKILRPANLVFALAILAAALAWMFTLRPESLGGPAGYVMVRGVSMLPTYHSGDLVIVQKEASYTRGEIIAYRIPEGDVGGGIVVIHRIVGGAPEEGFVLQGDNNPAPDDWRPKVADIIGSAWLVIPRGGAFLGLLRAPLLLASLAAGVAVAFLLVDPTNTRSSNGSGESRSNGQAIQTKP